MTIDREKLIDSRKHCMDLKNETVAVQSLNLSGAIIDVSPAWLKITGYEREEVIGKHFFEFLGQDTLKHVTECFPYLKDYGYVDEIPLNVKCKDASIVSVYLTGTSKYDEQGEFERTFCEIKPIW